MKKVRCKDCGLLALREANSTSLPDHPVNAELRDGSNGTADHYVHGNFYGAPFCCVSACKIHDEHAVLEKTDADKKRVFLAVINAERSCDSFAPWSKSFSPKEHLLMGYIEQIIAGRDAFYKEQLREQREWQDSMTAASDKRDQEWKEAERLRDEAWRREELEREDNRHWTTTAVAIITGVLGFLGGLLGGALVAK